MILASTWLLALAAALLAPGRSLAAIDRVLAHPDLAGVTASVAVVDLASGELLYARRANEPLTPASNLKLLTTAAAVSALGPDHHFRTSFYAAAEPDADGRLAGDLVAWGGGDPCLRTEILAAAGLAEPAGALADLLVQAGLTRVEGKLLLDDGWFDAVDLHPDWDPSDHAFPYAAPISALALHGNCLAVTVDGRGAAPSARLATEAAGYRVRNEVVHHGNPRAFEVGAVRPDDDGVIRVRGRLGKSVGEQTIRVPARDGTLLFGRCVLAQLARRGVTVAGGLEVRPGALAGLASPVELARLESSLATAVLLANKESDNAMAEHLLKTLGAAAGAGGSFEAGARAVTEQLGRLTDGAVGELVVRDGSGLSPANRVTTRGMVAVLSAMAAADDRARNLFLRSLPVSGLDGSMADRLREPGYTGAVRAKTGYISGTSGLSGYARGRSGDAAAFSILFNGVRPGRNRRMKELQDEVCRILVDAL